MVAIRPRPTVSLLLPTNQLAVRILPTFIWENRSIWFQSPLSQPLLILSDFLIFHKHLLCYSQRFQKAQPCSRCVDQKEKMPQMLFVAKRFKISDIGQLSEPGLNLKVCPSAWHLSKNYSCRDQRRRSLWMLTWTSYSHHHCGKWLR